MINLFVSNIPDNCNAKELREHFSGFGTCGKINVRKKAGIMYGFVQIEIEDDLMKAVEKMNESVLRGCKVKVERAKTNGEKKPAPVVEEEEIENEKEAEMVQHRDELPLVEEYKKEDEPRKKKNKIEKEEKEEPKKKIRDRLVPDVAKVTAWDEVIGHKWEEKDKSASTFSLLSIAENQQSDDEEKKKRSNFESAATRYFLKDVETEALKLQQPMKLTKNFEKKLENLGKGNEQPDDQEESMVLNFGGNDFVRNEREVDDILSQWQEQRKMLRKDFKKKKYKSKKN